jgi:hypothetical protein
MNRLSLRKQLGRRVIGGLGAFVAVVLTLAPTVERHTPGEAFDEQLPGASAETYFLSAAHPSAPAHFDSAQSAQRPLCPICLHRLTTAGSHGPQRAQLLAPELASRAAACQEAALVARATSTVGARAPPFS